MLAIRNAASTATIGSAVHRYLLRTRRHRRLGDRMRGASWRWRRAPILRASRSSTMGRCEAIHAGQGQRIDARAQFGDRFVLMHRGNIGMSQKSRVLIEAAALLKDQARMVIAMRRRRANGRRSRSRRRAARLKNVRFSRTQPKELLTVIPRRRRVSRSLKDGSKATSCRASSTASSPQAGRNVPR